MKDLAKIGLILSVIFAVYGAVQIFLWPAEADIVYGERLLQSAFSFFCFGVIAAIVAGIISYFRGDQR